MAQVIDDGPTRDELETQLATLNEVAKRLHASPAWDQCHRDIDEILDQIVGR